MEGGPVHSPPSQTAGAQAALWNSSCGSFRIPRDISRGTTPSQEGDYLQVYGCHTSLMAAAFARVGWARPGIQGVWHPLCMGEGLPQAY